MPKPSRFCYSIIFGSTYHPQKSKGGDRAFDLLQPKEARSLFLQPLRDRTIHLKVIMQLIEYR
ncbi:hypothetical protein [Coleofasciculus sp. H7-2]|uniref:hypothetical protein n=1 Tax=Coleofasciculus sp. H7-2 TaxID=3351545 RepID=UPI0036724F8B